MILAYAQSVIVVPGYGMAVAQAQHAVRNLAGELERRGVLKTRRGVGSFVSAPPEQARPPREHHRRLHAFVTRLLADADSAGFTIDDVTAALRARQQGGS